MTTPSGNPAVERAAAWLVDLAERDWRKPIVQQLREQFGLSVRDACEASARAQTIRSERYKAAVNQSVTQTVSREAEAGAG